MDIQTQVNVLKFYEAKILDDRHSLDSLIPLVSIEFFGYLLKHTSLKSILDSRIYYFVNLSIAKRFLKLENLLVSTIGEVMTLFSDTDFSTIGMTFDCSSFETEDSSSVNAKQFTVILGKEASFRRLRNYNISLHALKLKDQYREFEKLITYLNIIAESSAKPELLQRYKSLILTFQFSLNEYESCINNYCISNHIPAFEELFIWTLDKASYPEYILFPVSQGRNRIKIDEEELRQVCVEVIDNIVIALQTEDIVLKPEVISADKVLSSPDQRITLDIERGEISIDTDTKKVQLDVKEIRMLTLLLNNGERISHHVATAKEFGFYKESRKDDKDYKEEVKEVIRGMKKYLASLFPEQEEYFNSAFHNQRRTGYYL